MIVKVENIYPEVRFFTREGHIAPEQIWVDTETGVRAMTKKEVLLHNEMLEMAGFEIKPEVARSIAQLYGLEGE